MRLSVCNARQEQTARPSAPADARPQRSNRFPTLPGDPARRLGLALALSLLLAASLAGSGTAAARAGGRFVVASHQALASLLVSQQALSAPSAGASVVSEVAASRPITGTRTVLPVLGERKGAGGAEWLHVLLPGRPNGHTGWIRQRGTVSSSTGWHLVVDTSTRQLIVYDAGRRLRVFEAIVGKPSTPTPRGSFFVEEGIQLAPDQVGAPFALALSARSDVLQEFDGGPGQIALHGLAHIGGVLGTAVSHGCVRLGAASLRWLLARIGAGTPVTITN